jgi:hypothetical protein
MGDRRERRVEGDRRNEYDDPLARREEERYQDDGDPAEPGGERCRHDHQPPVPHAVDDVDRGHLQEFGERRDGGEQADDGVRRTELESEGYEEDAAGQRHHRLGGKAVPGDEFQAVTDLFIGESLFCFKDHASSNPFCRSWNHPPRSGRTVRGNFPMPYRPGKGRYMAPILGVIV